MNGRSRAEEGSATVPLANAAFCVNCENISSSPHDACNVCGSRSLISLFRVLGGTLRGQRSSVAADHPKYSLQLVANVHEIAAAELNLLIELLARLAEVAGTVESLHLNVESTPGSRNVLRAA